MNDDLILDSEATKAQAAFDNAEYLKAAVWFKSLVKQHCLSGEKIKAAEMGNNCCVAFLKAGKPELALEIIKGTEKIFEESGDPRSLAMTIGNRGAAFEALGKVDEALRDYQESAEIFKNNDNQELFISTIQAISSLQFREGRLQDAVLTLRDGVDQYQGNQVMKRIVKTILNLPNEILKR